MSIEVLSIVVFGMFFAPHYFGNVRKELLRVSTVFWKYGHTARQLVDSGQCLNMR